MYRHNSGRFVIEYLYDFIGLWALRRFILNKSFKCYFDIFILPTIFVKDYYLPKGCWYL